MDSHFLLPHRLSFSLLDRYFSERLFWTFSVFLLILKLQILRHLIKHNFVILPLPARLTPLLSLSLFLSLPPLSLSLSLSLYLFLSASVFHTLFHCLSHSISVCISLPHTLSLPLSLSHSLSTFRTVLRSEYRNAKNDIEHFTKSFSLQSFPVSVVYFKMAAPSLSKGSG